MIIIATYYLVDYENVHSQGLAGCDKTKKRDHIIFFFNSNGNTINMSSICHHGESELEFREVAPGKQSVDQHIADLKEAVERYTDIDLWSETVREKLPEPLSAGRTPKVDGKGKNKYYEIMNAHLPITGSSNSQSVKLFKRIIY